MQDIHKIISSFANAPAFEVQKFIAAHQEPAVNSFRINRKKITVSPFENASPVPWCADGFYLKERAKYAQHPYWHGGAIYVQEASSMFLFHALQQVLPLQEALCVLDACAAPGGKSTLIAALLNNESVLVSNEVIKSRVSVLRENMIKWGNNNSIITNSDTQHFGNLPPLFDCIVVDAPCSGSGLFRKDAAAINEWSENNVQLCSERQQRILSNLLPALKNEGVIAYSTCSYSMEENETMVNWLCEKHNLETIRIDVPKEWNIVNSQDGCYRFYPYLVRGEGFFMALLRKKSDRETKKTDVVKTLKIIKQDSSFTQFIEGSFNFFLHQEHVFAATLKVLETTEILRQQKINLIQCGVEIGTQKFNKFIPAHALALNEALGSTVETIEMDEPTAMNYLRKQTINIESSFGYKILRYQGVNLGWVNVMEHRTNNMYPTHWRLMH